MDKKTLEKLLNNSLTTGADFSEIYYEDSLKRNIILTNKRIDDVVTVMESGVGFRLAKGDKMVYSSTNHLEFDHLEKKVEELKSIFQEKPIYQNVTLQDKNINNKKIDYHNEMSYEDKKKYLLRIDEIARGYSDKVEQVKARFIENEKNVIVANHLGEYSTDKRYLFRLIIEIYVKDGEKHDSTFEAYGNSLGYVYLDNFDIEKEVKRLVDVAIDKLSAVPCPTGRMPVVIGPGFGAVIIHEACGHALEATSVAKKVSVLFDKKGKKIANEKVTIIDDGAIDGEWGSTYIDDEGERTKKNILIENGILTNFLIDKLNNRIMKSNITGSGRRESYLYPPTSRMNNTYLANGVDSFSDMIESIDYGIYAKTMNGGSVNTNTGDFNFGVCDAYLIEKGKITKMVKGASLIGNTLEILQNIEMVGDDLSLQTGYCGSVSGHIPVTCGEPHIKVSSILVGGNDNDS